MLQIVTEFCLLHLTASHAGCKYFFLSSKVHAENFSRRYMCVCIATAVDFSIQVQMNQWKIVWLPVWMNLMLLLEVVLSLVRVIMKVCIEVADFVNTGVFQTGLLLIFVYCCPSIGFCSFPCMNCYFSHAQTSFLSSIFLQLKIRKINLTRTGHRLCYLEAVLDCRQDLPWSLYI